MITVTGSTGKLGQALQRRVGLNPNYIWATRSHFNIVDRKKTAEYFAAVKDALTVHLAAYTATSRAEAERNECYNNNVVGTRNVARACAQILYVSTDHVFDGNKGDYAEEDEPCPWNHYGWTKLLSECEVRAVGGKIIRCTFRPKPFPYPVAWNDSLTTVMWVDEMAEALQWCIENYEVLPPVLHVGGKKQDYHSFALENGPVAGEPAPIGFPKDLSLDTTKYRALRSQL